MFLLCANVDGTENLPPLMVGKSHRPRCFHGQNLREFGVHYDHGPKGWMKSSIFAKWLAEFDCKVELTPGCKVLLFIDNASSHGNSRTLPSLQNIQVEFLPKRTTSILQPLDLGVIACVKSRYRQRITQRAADLIDSGISERIYQIDLKRAAIWVTEIWENLQNEIVHNCWSKSTIV